MVVAETLAGIALVNSAVKGIKSAIGTAKDISEIANDIDNLFDGIEEKLAEEQVVKVRRMIDRRFGLGTWDEIIEERKRRIEEHKEKQNKLVNSTMLIIYFL